MLGWKEHDFGRYLTWSDFGYSTYWTRCTIMVNFFIIAKIIDHWNFTFTCDEVEICVVEWEYVSCSLRGAKEGFGKRVNSALTNECVELRAGLGSPTLLSHFLPPTSSSLPGASPSPADLTNRRHCPMDKVRSTRASSQERRSWGRQSIFCPYSPPYTLNSHWLISCWLMSAPRSTDTFIV